MKLEQQDQQAKLNQTLDHAAADCGFSGVAEVAQDGQILASAAYGQANLAEVLLNQRNTRFGIASGCKLFTAIAICQLVEQKKLSFSDKVLEIVESHRFPLFDPGITVHHLLTHSSGIADYFDEEIMEDFAELWKELPMYTLRQPADFLPLFSTKPMKFTPGGRFHYNNAGYILLGLIVETVSGLSFADYVEQEIFRRAGMADSGYFALDQLPARTASGYIEEEDGSLRTNIYSIPVKGGADGGAFTTAPDMLKLWQNLLQHKLLGPELTALLLTPHIHEADDEYYGYGIWITMQQGRILKYHLMGSDPGVSFRSAVYPASGTQLAVLCNRSRGAYRIMQAIEQELQLT